MEPSPDFKGIEDFLNKDPLLRRLYDEHKTLEKKISKLEKKPYPTPVEEREEKRLKKLKLLGKDRIIRLLEQHRNA